MKVHLYTYCNKLRHIDGFMVQRVFIILAPGPRESSESAISINIYKISDYDQNLTFGAYLSIKSNP